MALDVLQKILVHQGEKNLVCVDKFESRYRDNN